MTVQMMKRCSGMGIAGSADRLVHSFPRSRLL